MKKSKFFIAIGALALTVSAFIAKANSPKYAGTSSAYFQTSGGAWNTLFKNLTSPSNAPLLTTINSGSFRSLYVCSNGISKGLYKTKSTAAGNRILVKLTSL